MANGWARDGAVLDQIEDSVSDAVRGARARLPAGESLNHCALCGEEIPERWHCPACAPASRVRPSGTTASAERCSAH